MRGTGHRGETKHQTPLADLAPLQRFSERAGDYVKFRPTYPQAAIDLILDGLGDPREIAAADVGAGTGISARLLAERGCTVAAIEPNEAMREAAEPHERVRWLGGTAEATGLADASVGLVLCAQAFHWFRAEEALREFVRILRPGGRVALVWNIRDEADAFTFGYGEAMHRAATDHAIDKDPQTEQLAASPLFRGFRELRAEGIPQRLTADGLIGRAVSSSYAPREGPAHERMVAELRALHGRHADAFGFANLRYVTEVHLAERA